MLEIVYEIDKTDSKIYTPYEHVTDFEQLLNHVRSTPNLGGKSSILWVRLNYAIHSE